MAEDQAHLLMATKWDVCGGKGGQFGTHGRPGEGGRGEKGGKGHEWEARIGYVYSCTDQCIAGETTSNSNSLVRYKSLMDTNHRVALVRVGAQSVIGDNMAVLLAQAAARFRALRQG